MTWQTAAGHVVMGLGIVGALCGLAVGHVIPGSDAFTGIMAVAVGSGVVAGANLTKPGPTA